MDATLTIDGEVLTDKAEVVWENLVPGQSSYFYLMTDEGHVAAISDAIQHYMRDTEPACRLITSDGQSAAISISDYSCDRDGVCTVLCDVHQRSG